MINDNSKKVNQKHMQVGKEHPGRDEIFRRINKAIEDFRNEGDPVLSRIQRKKSLLKISKITGRNIEKKRMDVKFWITTFLFQNKARLLSMEFM